MQDASPTQTSTPLTPLPEQHWRDLWKEQAERNNRHLGGRPTMLTEDDIAELTWRYHHEPHTPVWMLAADFGIARSSVYRYVIPGGR